MDAQADVIQIALYPVVYQQRYRALDVESFQSNRTWTLHVCARQTTQANGSNLAEI